MHHALSMDLEYATGHTAEPQPYWCGAQHGPRGRGAKGKCPFVAAVSMNEKGHPMFMRFSVVKGFRFKTGELTRWLKSPKS
ncbi:hypothetical protein AA106_04275 [Photorhabdus laumondii subsp. laumondii]|nr:hypothetical protein AA106_04275 [Photorhabdus laumondii subsp. laumondii]